MRVTTNSMMRQYGNRLNDVLQSLNKANQKVITQRKFSRGSEAPADALKAYQLRREFKSNEDYMENVGDMQSMFDTAESSMMKISKIAEDSYVDVLSALNETKDVGDRTIIANKLREMQKSIILDANTRYEDKFLFGGSSTKELPFSISDDGKVTYRGIDVNAIDDPDDPNDDFDKLTALTQEKLYIDLGFGMDFDANGQVVPGSAYNASIPGLEFLGFGMDEDGNCNNIITNLGKIADLLEQDPLPSEDLDTLSKKLDGQRKNILANITKLGSNTMFLDYTAKRLDNTEFNLTKKMDSTEFVNIEEAINEFKMYDYTYRAALKMGMDILSPSFIDFMK